MNCLWALWRGGGLAFGISPITENKICSTLSLFSSSPLFLLMLTQQSALGMLHILQPLVWVAFQTRVAFPLPHALWKRVCRHTGPWEGSSAPSAILWGPEAGLAVNRNAPWEAWAEAHVSCLCVPLRPECFSSANPEWSLLLLLFSQIKPAFGLVRDQKCLKRKTEGKRKLQNQPRPQPAVFFSQLFWT